MFWIVGISASSQDGGWQWWNDAHGWDPGDPGWRNWMIVAPGNLGPNALPVPEPGNGIIQEFGEMKASLSRHFHPGDPTQDISFHLRVPFADGKIAVEAFGVVLENYNYTEEIRNSRFSRDVDGKGVGQGDLYFSTLIQLARDRAFPNTVLRMACKTASGNLQAARFSDSPGYFVDVSSSKDFRVGRFNTLRAYVDLGFFSWQTNDEATPQNDALLYGAGMEWTNGHLLLSGSLSGYSGYMSGKYEGKMLAYSEKYKEVTICDQPVVVTAKSRYDWDYTAAELQFTQGLRDWEYSSFRFSFIWKFTLL